MTTEHSSDVEKARRLMEEASGKDDFIARMQKFERALDLLERFLASHPGSEEREYIEALRYTYTRALMNTLPPAVDTNTLLKIVPVFVQRIGEEVREVRKRHPEAEEVYLKCMTSCGSEVFTALEKAFSATSQ